MNTTVANLVLLAILAGAIPESSFIQPSQTAKRPSDSSLTTAVEDERGTVALDQALREISNPFTVLCVAARPGDEDDGTLAYVRKKLGARAVILIATRGEAEDSPSRPELDQELGVVRTREAIEAARVIGADVSFLNLRDIGYSKSADEVLSIWGHDEALRRMVRAIRSLRPDVIITNHHSKKGEGTHQAIARLALEAFNESGETKLAPEAGSEPWQVRRYFERTDDPGGVRIDLNEYDSVRGLTYSQIGLAAHHRFLSRGAGLDRSTPEREGSYYKLTASTAEDESRTENGSPGGLLAGLKLPDNLSRTIAPPRVADTGLVSSIAAGDRLIDALTEKLVEMRAEGSADVMHERYGPEFVRVVRFTAAIERAIVLALGLNLEVTISDSVVVPGQIASARIVFRNGGVRAFPVAFSSPESLPAPDKNPSYKVSDVIGVGPRGIAIKEFDYEFARDTMPTLPHAAHLYDEDYYGVGSTLPGTQPGAPFGHRLIASADIGLGQTSIRMSALARFDVAPPVEISTIPFALVSDWSKQRDITFPLRVRNRTPGRLAGALWVVPIALADDEYDPVHIAFAREDEEVTIKMKLRLPILKPPLAPDVLIEFRRERPAAPDPLGSAKVSVRASGFEVVDGLKAGYIRGLDDWLSFAFSELGIEHSELKIDEISATEHGNAVSSAQSRIGCGDLTRFDTIVVDSNAYSAHPELNRHNRCLLRYVRQGGNLVVLSQTPDDWNLVLANTQFAPYPIKLTKDRITIETAAVKLLEREHPLISKPNKLEARDFDGWVVERAVNIPGEWSSEYSALLDLSDPGEEPKRGSLLVARHGEGTFIYVSLSMRRQLLAGTAGAYRIFADLVSYPKVLKPNTRPQ
jgi:LmbE family N-acetylglucosaminyl deacetylase